MATFNLEIVPFSVPDRVTLKMPAGKRQDGIRPPVEVMLPDLSDEQLAALIEEFAAYVMAAARPT